MIPAQLKANDIGTLDGASMWLSSLPLKHERLSLTKREFDAVLLRYGLEINVYHTNVPAKQSTTLIIC